MERSKKVIFISHCILNQNTVVSPLARAKGPYRDIINIIMDYGIGIHQLPCPEFRHLGLKREPMTKEEYDTEEYRILCKKISKDIINVMKEYLNNGYQIVGLIGINSSPTCGIRKEKGILMEELLSLASELEINLKTIDVPTNYRDGDIGKEFVIELERFIKSSTGNKEWQ